MKKQSLAENSPLDEAIEHIRQRTIEPFGLKRVERRHWRWIGERGSPDLSKLQPAHHDASASWRAKPRGSNAAEPGRLPHMSVRESAHLDPDPHRTCQAAREKMRAAGTKLARLHLQLPMSREAFAAQIQRVADEHAQPCGCELRVQANSDGLVEVRIKVPQVERQCDVCKTIECFFHPRTE